MATDYDELRTEVKESQNNSLQAVKSANAPGARAVVRDLDEVDAFDDAAATGGEFVSDELIIHVIPQAQDEFTCHSCFLVRHKFQIARESAGQVYCLECEA